MSVPLDSSRSEIIREAAQCAGLDDAVVDDMLARLYEEYPDQVPAEWAAVRSWLLSQTLADEQVDSLISYFQGIEGGIAADDPSRVLDYPVLRGESATETSEWVEAGSLVYRVGGEFYRDGHQVWQATNGEQVYYHDGTNTYDTMGRQLSPSPGATQLTATTSKPNAMAEPKPTVAKAVKAMRSILDAAITAVPGAENLTQDEIREVLNRLSGAANSSAG